MLKIFLLFQTLSPKEKHQVRAFRRVGRLCRRKLRVRAVFCEPSSRFFVCSRTLWSFFLSSYPPVVFRCSRTLWLFFLFSYPLVAFSLFSYPPCVFCFQTLNVEPSGTFSLVLVPSGRFSLVLVPSCRFSLALAAFMRFLFPSPSFRVRGQEGRTLKE